MPDTHPIQPGDLVYFKTGLPAGFIRKRWFYVVISTHGSFDKLHVKLYDAFNQKIARSTYSAVYLEHVKLD